MTTPGAANRSAAYFWRVVFAIDQRSSRAAFIQPGIYVVLTVGLLLASILIHNSLRFTQLNAVLTTTQPVLLPMFVTTTLFSIYVALRVAIETTRERANRTLEVLFYGPVSASMFLWGHFIGGLRIYAGGLVIIFIWANVVMWLLNIALDVSLLAMLVASLLSAAALIAFGILVGVLGGRSRNTLIVFVGSVLLLMSLQAADVVVTDVIPTPAGATSNDPLITLRIALNSITRVIGWVSPYTQLQQVSNDLLDRRPLQASIHIGVLISQTAILMTLSTRLLRRIGAR